MYVHTLTYIWISAILAALYREDPTHIAQIPPILYFAVYIHMYIRTYIVQEYIRMYVHMTKMYPVSEHAEMEIYVCK